MKSFNEFNSKEPLEESQEAKLKKAHLTWRKSIEDVFKKRMKAINKPVPKGSSLGGMSDGEILRILDNIGW